MNVVAKFKCVSIKQLDYGNEIEMMAVMGDTEENKSFSDYTPTGNLKFMVVKDKPAATAFNVGKEYKILISEA